MSGLFLTEPRALETERLILRMPNGDDAAAMIAFYADDRSRFYGGPKPLGDAWRDLASRIGHWALRGNGMFAITLKDSGETIGFAGPVHAGDYPEPEMSWLLTEARFEGKGYAREACEAVITYCFAEYGWVSMPSYIDRDNDASRALALRLGATLDPDTTAPIPNADVYRHRAQADGGMEAYA